MSVAHEFERPTGNQQRSTKDPIDAKVGQNVKLRRGIVGMSQTVLADSLGITFQQVQKYEKGANRIGASRLYRIAEILDCDLKIFFAGVETGEDPQPIDPKIEALTKFHNSADGIALSRSIAKIENPTIRKRIYGLARAIADSSSAED